MTEHDLHEPLRRLAETAPAPAPGLAGDVVERGRTTRRRRLGGVAVAGAAAVAALVVLVPVLGSGSTDQGAEPSVATDPATTEPTPTPPPEPSARMQVAAAGMRALLEDSYPTEDALWVRDRVCLQDSFNGRRGECIDLTAAEQTELERLLSTYSITWVDRFPRDLEGKPYVGISGLEDVNADGGSVYVSAVRGGLDCAGAPFQVRIHQNGTAVAEQGNEFLIC